MSGLNRFWFNSLADILWETGARPIRQRPDGCI